LGATILYDSRYEITLDILASWRRELHPTAKYT
jgi:hypothetical protein